MPFLQDSGETTQTVSKSFDASQDAQSSIPRVDSPFNKIGHEESYSTSKTSDNLGKTQDTAVRDEDETTKKSKQILEVIESYGVRYTGPNRSWQGFDAFLPMVKEKVTNSLPIQLILPAFPMKSPNRTNKVLGRLPDFGEELALHHLNGVCDNISDIYEFGAELVIQSDGLVYNGRLNVF